MGFTSTTDSIISIWRYQFCEKIESISNRTFIKIVKSFSKWEKDSISEIYVAIIRWSLLITRMKWRHPVCKLSSLLSSSISHPFENTFQPDLSDHYPNKTSYPINPFFVNRWHEICYWWHFGDKFISLTWTSFKVVSSRTCLEN